MDTNYAPQDFIREFNETKDENGNVTLNFSESWPSITGDDAVETFENFVFEYVIGYVSNYNYSESEVEQLRLGAFFAMDIAKLGVVFNRRLW